MQLDALDWVFLIACLGSYLVAWKYSLSRKELEGASRLRLPMTWVVAGLLWNTAFLIHRGLAQHVAPVANLFEICLFFTWCLAVMLAFMSYAFHYKGLPRFVMPLVCLLFALAAYGLMQQPEVEPGQRSVIRTVHVTTIMLSTAIFAFSCLSGMLYLMQERRLKNKNFTTRSLLPPLELLDKLNLRLVLLGFPLFSFSMILGVIYAQSDTEQMATATWLGEPRVVSGIIAWALYALLLHLRLNSTYQGRRVAVLTIINFITLFISFLGTEIFWKNWHSS